MSKRSREHEDQDDTTNLDPAVKAVIEGYEGNLAQFMDSLSSLLERYNGLLQAALPHNPKAVFYYQAEDEANKADGTIGEKKDVTITADGANASTTSAVAATPTTAASASGHSFPSAPRVPTSPLLRRPQLPPQQLEEMKLEAKAELERRTSNFSFPTSADLAHVKDASARSPDLKHQSHAVNGSSKAPSITLDPSAAAVAKSASATPAATSTTTANLGIRTQLNKVLDKKAMKEAAKKINAEEEAAATANGGEEKKEGSAAAATTTTTAEDDDTANNATPAGPATTALIENCTRTVAEVLSDVEMPPMLLAQLRILKKESQALMFTFDQIHDWIAMKAPAMNETDNQGVAIMASVISVISSIMSSLQDLYDMEREYINKRGQLEVQYVPNFECATIKELIQATDSTKWDDIEVGWRTMMRAVIIVHSRLAQNMKTLRTPKEKRMHHMSM